MQYLLPKFDGDVMFKLPLVKYSSNLAGLMHLVGTRNMMVNLGVRQKLQISKT